MVSINAIQFDIFYVFQGRVISFKKYLNEYLTLKINQIPGIDFF